MAYFLEDLTGDYPKPNFYQGFYLQPKPKLGYTFAASLEDFWSWYDSQPAQIVLLESFFRESLIFCQSWQAWSNSLPPARYAELAAASAVGSWLATQRLYNAIKASYQPPATSVTEWKGIAAAYGIPLTF